MAEVYAGFCEYTDVQAGRVIDYLEESGQLENTIITYAADNGASGEDGGRDREQMVEERSHARHGGATC